MDDAPIQYPVSWNALDRPVVRHGLILTLQELATPDPRPIWDAQRRRGLWAGIDETIHYLFDDYPLDEHGIGDSLFDLAEVQAVSAVTRALDPLIAALPEGQDDEYVSHPAWPQVTAAAATVHALLAPR